MTTLSQPQRGFARLAPLVAVVTLLVGLAAAVEVEAPAGDA